jgi:hypothetical protein
MTLPTVFPHSADARQSDPIESHEARDSISNEMLAESQAEVLAILCLYGPQPDHDIQTIHELRQGFGATEVLLSGQRLRTARHELVELGMVRKSDIPGVTPSGRRASVWAVAS